MTTDNEETDAQLRRLFRSAYAASAPGPVRQEAFAARVAARLEQVRSAHGPVRTLSPFSFSVPPFALPLRHPGLAAGCVFALGLALGALTDLPQGNAGAASSYAAYNYYLLGGAR